MLLSEAGFAFDVITSDVDDAQLQRGEVTPRQWVAALAYLKARAAAERVGTRATERRSDEATEGKREDDRDSIIIGADTVCVCAGEILGQPLDADDARWMLEQLRSAVHETITGVCLLVVDCEPGAPPRRLLFVDAATVRIGNLSDATIDTYIASGEWRGKAGAYNLSERIADGWPIECVGDPATVMGLPMHRLTPLLRRFLQGAGLDDPAGAADRTT